MSEKISSILQSSGDELRIPDADKEFYKIVDAAKHSQIFGFPKKELDKIYLFWKERLPELAETNSRMAKALQLDGIPQAELTQAEEYHKRLSAAIKVIIDPLQSLLSKTENARWKEDGRPIYKAILEYERKNRVPYEGSITALLEAIAETKDGYWKDEADMRQRIAQGLIKELETTCVYEQYYYAAEVESEVTTVDYLNQEKEEFLAALRRKEKWDTEEIEQHQKTIRILKQFVEDIDDNLLKKLDILWKTAMGKVPKKVTAIDLIIATEELFQNLKDEGLLEWEPDEE